MYCSNCGSNIEGEKVCSNCGAEGLELSAKNIENEKINLISAYKSMLKKYARFNGRSRRSEYWLANLANTIIIFGFSIVVNILLAIAFAVNNNGEPSVLFSFFSLIIGLYMCALFVPGLALSVRRLHDTGRSGWFLLLNLIPYVGGIIIFVFMVLDSTPGPNQYGPNPKER